MGDVEVVAYGRRVLDARSPVLVPPESKLCGGDAGVARERPAREQAAGERAGAIGVAEEPRDFLALVGRQAREVGPDPAGDVALAQSRDVETGRGGYGSFDLGPIIGRRPGSLGAMTETDGTVD